ncbi:beta-1,6-N-acetylglucosaminyltransferase [Bifidobacterium eulemuris]|uniref:Peptide O-xylosyltransferase n=1 Tax=Bifidobacterium eulemuris TaxID=1765219 RepID=A0A261GAV0_9BIFI|nr:beta-1,6-N-acetylglucosaminyltransferase [Bifidobacterium eulemuris]OZG68548.1 glycosyl transferase [Bifidobacterium eulemuris]QOL32678.1 glycosyl transferase [Bifidobacterium eulemuris]
MKHAFLIMAHNNWNQLKTLISLLDDERCSIFLHVDNGSKSFNQQMFEGLTEHASLRFLPRMNISWGGDRQIFCEMLLLKESRKSNCDYYHLLSGMDLPLHKIDYIDRFFEEHNGKEFVHFTEIGDSISTSTRDRIAIWHPFQNQLGRHCSYVDFALSNIQKSIHVDRLQSCTKTLGKGAQWFSITRNFVDYVITNWSYYQKMFTNSYCADEMFLQTMLLNSPLRKNIFRPEPDDDYASIMRIIDWERGNPYVFRACDLETLRNSAMLFARKFDERIDNNVIMKIAKEIRSSN